jgi:hypothetical protein
VRGQAKLERVAEAFLHRLPLLRRLGVLESGALKPN